MSNNNTNTKTGRPALPKNWIVPIRLAIYAVLAACSAYVYFNYREMEFTHFLILIPIVIVSSMAALDCKMSTRYWDEQERKQNQDQNKLGDPE